MNTIDLYTRWSSMSLDDIQAELQADDSLPTAERLFGAEDVAQMRESQGRRTTRGPRKAVVLLPGLMGSLLSSIRGTTTLLWINPALILKGQSRYLELDETGTADAAPNILSVPTTLELTCYLKIALRLQNEALLFEFPYDWRLPIEENGDLLGKFLDRWSAGDDDMRFTLVGHSMGGLVSRAYVARHAEDAKRRVERVIMHGTPHFGAAGAVADIWRGNSMMAIGEALNGNNDFRRMVLNMPSAYQLLPAPPDLFPKGRPYPVNFDVYQAAEWRLPGVRQNYLDRGRQFHELLADHNHPVEMIEIAGCHLATKTDVMLRADADERPVLDLVTTSEGPDSGDATVPLYSAVLPGATMYYVQEKHRYLSRNTDVIKATLDLIYGRKPKLPTKLPKPKGGWFDFRTAGGSPEAQAQQMRQRFENGTATEEDFEKLSPLCPISAFNGSRAPRAITATASTTAASCPSFAPARKTTSAFQTRARSSPSPPKSPTKG